MNKHLYISILCAGALLSAVSCFKEPTTEGYIGDGIYLQGADTMHVTIGAKSSSSTAWLDNSTRPVTFVIEDVRDEEGNHAAGFFEEFDTRVWVTPYDYLTDTTSELVLAKLKDTKITPIMINSVNGQLRAMESTEEIGVKPGDVFHVDVKASNSKGVRHLKDYAIILFEEGEQSNDFVINDLVNGIAVMNSSGEYEFPYYDQINSNQSNFETRRSNIYADNGKERNMRVYKTSEEPSVGVHVVIRFLDKNGNLFDPARYASYSTLNSYIDYGVNRQNTSEGLELDFPLTPWPVATDAYQYLRGPVYQNFSNLDVASLKADNQAGRIPYNAKWPSNDYAGAKGWFVRMRSQMTFYQHGSYVIELKVPYSTVM